MHTSGKMVRVRDPLMTASTPCVPRRSYHRLRMRRRVLPLLASLTLLSGLAITGIAYTGMRLHDTNVAQAEAMTDARVARQVLGEQGALLAVAHGTLVAGTPSAPLLLNGDTTVVDKVRDLTGADTAIYQVKDGNLVAIASNVPLSDASGQAEVGTRALGAALPASTADLLLSQCGVPGGIVTTCGSAFSGVLTQRGIDYVAGFAPLTSSSGSLVGAIGALDPLGDVVAPANELGIILLLATLLATGLAAIGASFFTGAPSRGTLAKLDVRLNEVAIHAADLEQFVRAQVGRSQRQERLARQVSESTRELNMLMEVVEQGQAALRDSTSEIWAGMSQPGQTLEPAAATRLARQAAITAGRIGAAAEDARERCRSLIGMMNQVIAEGHVLSDGGRMLETRANALRTAIERVETALGAQVVERQYDLPGNPFKRPRTAQPVERDPRATSQGPAVGARTGRQPSVGGGPVSKPGMSDSRFATGIYPAGSSGQWPGVPSVGSLPRSLPGPQSPVRPNSMGSAHETSRPPRGLPPRGSDASAGRQAAPSRPLWSEAGLNMPSFPGGSLPGISLPGIPLSGQGPAVPGGYSGRPASPYPGGRPPRQRAPLPATELPGGDVSLPGVPFAGGRMSQPGWSGQFPSVPGGDPRSERSGRSGKHPMPNGDASRAGWPPLPKQPSTASPFPWPLDGTGPAFPPNGPRQGPGREPPNTDWLNS